MTALGTRPGTGSGRAGRLGFPPRTGYLVLPGGDRRAAVSGLALYTPLYARQVAAVAATRALLRLGAGRVLRLRPQVELPDDGAWRRWLAEVVEPHVGPVADQAWLPRTDDRTCALLLDAAGAPLAFVKLRSHEEADRSEPAVLRLLATRPARTFRTPRLIADADFLHRHARVLEPLPEGPHRRPPRDPARVAAVVDELQELLEDLPRPAGVPARWRPAHGDLSPRNVRVAGDGHWWVYDWEYAGWGPRLADELRYWIADHAFRRGTDPVRDAERVLALLLRRGSESDVVDALHRRHFGKPAEDAIRRQVARLVGADPAAVTRSAP